MNELLTILEGDALTRLRELPDECVQCVVTSPPYWALRDYNAPGQLGLEASPWEYVDRMTEVFREVKRVLRKDGTAWVNLGDCYNGQGARSPNIKGDGTLSYRAGGRAINVPGLKKKDLIGMPWHLAFALQKDGWFLRADIVWSKPNPMPESVRDRPTKAHEYIFLLSKSDRYFYDAEAITEPTVGSARANGGAKTNGNMKAVVRGGVNPKCIEPDGRTKQNTSFAAAVCLPVLTRNKRSVWTVPTAAFSDAHFATYPPALVSPCILAGSKPGDLILDPFGGSGTTGAVAIELGRRALLIELNPAYVDMIRRRCGAVTPGLPLQSREVAA